MKTKEIRDRQNLRRESICHRRAAPRPGACRELRAFNHRRDWSALPKYGHGPRGPGEVGRSGFRHEAARASPSLDSRSWTNTRCQGTTFQHAPPVSSGDFYECFDTDAETAHKALGLTITRRGALAMAGFPHHQLEAYLRKLLKEGHRVAICDRLTQVPELAKVDRVVVPGDSPQVAERGRP